MWTRIICGNSLRKSRLHDEKGNIIRSRHLLTHGPQALATGLLRLGFNYRPELPWIPYSGIEILKKHLTKQSRILEFGSGMSTIWYGKHAQEVYSVDDYEPWFRKVNEIIARNRLSNITYIYAQGQDEYCNFMSDDQAGFDLITVDGSHRCDCVRKSIRLLNPGGLLYLDDSDRHSTPEGGETRESEAFILDYMKQNRGEVSYVTDFSPTQLFVKQGMFYRQQA